MSFKLKKKDFVDVSPKTKKRRTKKQKTPSLPEKISSHPSVSKLH